jgi:spore germination protein (amino acid permease)
MKLMKNEEKIGHREALTLLVVMMSAKVMLSFPRNMILLGKSAGWMIVLFSAAISLAGIFFIYSLVKKYPEQNIIEISREVAGSAVGSCFGILIFLFFLLITAMFLRQFAESFILAVLPRTPISIITLTFIVLLVYSCSLGIETLTRLAWFFGPYILLAFIIIILFSLPETSWDQLVPIMGNGPIPLLKESLGQTSLFVEVLLFGLIAPLIRHKEKLGGVAYYSILLATLINAGVTIIVLMVFNYVAAAKLIFPIFQLSRLIALEEFFQRVEAVFVFLWFFTGAIQLSGLFYGAVASFSQTFKIKDYHPLILPIALLTFAISLLPPSMAVAVDLNDLMFSKYYSIIAFGIPVLLWCLTFIPKRRTGEQH